MSPQDKAAEARRTAGPQPLDLRTTMRTVRPPKPRLKLYMGCWLCETTNLTAKGRTPTEAYRAWRNAAVIRGAEVMRSLRPFA